MFAARSIPPPGASHEYPVDATHPEAEIEMKSEMRAKATNTTKTTETAEMRSRKKMQSVAMRMLTMIAYTRSSWSHSGM